MKGRVRGANQLLKAAPKGAGEEELEEGWYLINLGVGERGLRGSREGHSKAYFLCTGNFFLICMKNNFHHIQQKTY